MIVTAGGVALPKLDLGAADRIAVEIDDPTDDVDWLADGRAASPLEPSQVGVVVRRSEDGIKWAEILRRGRDQ